VVAVTRWRVEPLPKDWYRIRARVLRRDGYRCRIGYDCCVGEATQVDHRIPASRGGTDDESNLQAACRACHDRKTILERRLPSRRRPPEPHPGVIA
jgi:5-methylcytosine-specific restriction endonuclease McrA